MNSRIHSTQSTTNTKLNHLPFYKWFLYFLPSFTVNHFFLPSTHIYPLQFTRESLVKYIQFNLVLYVIYTYVIVHPFLYLIKYFIHRKIIFNFFVVLFALHILSIFICHHQCIDNFATRINCIILCLLLLLLLCDIFEKMSNCCTNPFYTIYIIEEWMKYKETI